MSEDNIKELIKKQVVSDVECIELIQAYISEMKSESVKINKPTDPIRLHMMNELYMTALGYFGKKYNGSV
jgi:hypothetical protein